MIDCKISRVILCFFLLNFLACESNTQKEDLKHNNLDDNENYSFNKGMLWGTQICMAA